MCRQGHGKGAIGEDKVSCTGLHSSAPFFTAVLHVRKCCETKCLIINYEGTHQKRVLIWAKRQPPTDERPQVPHAWTFCRILLPTRLQDFPKLTSFWKLLVVLSSRGQSLGDRPNDLDVVGVFTKWQSPSQDLKGSERQGSRKG